MCESERRASWLRLQQLRLLLSSQSFLPSLRSLTPARQAVSQVCPAQSQQYPPRFLAHQSCQNNLYQQQEDSMDRLRSRSRDDAHVAMSSAADGNSRSTTPKGLPRAVLPDAATRDKSLRAELAQLKQMNTTIESLNQTLSTARVNLATMQTNMTAAKSLLKTWTRILSQAEHNQRLILNPEWPGATQDLHDIETEDAKRQEEAQQKIEAEARRREEAQRKLESDARRREDSERSRGRGLGRTRSTRGSVLGSGASTRGAAQGTSGRGTANTRRATSGIARGVPGRGRGRG